jgi:CRP/FNR family transcriptional regulator
MDPHKKAVLESLSFFQGLPTEVLERIGERMVRREVPEGWILFRTGEVPRGVYVLAKGRVEVFRSSPGGREQVLHTEVPVQSIAELPLFDGGEYPASARAAEPSELYFLSRDDFQRLYREHPGISDAVIRDLGRRLRKLVQLVDRLSLKDVPARVAAALLDAAAAEDALKDGAQFEMRRTQEELAHALGTTRESVARALASFRNQGIIDQVGRNVTLLSLANLSRIESGE